MSGDGPLQVARSARRLIYLSRLARSSKHVLVRLIAGAALAVIVYSYEAALYFGNALEYNGYWAQEAGLFVAALSSSVELVAAISMARFSRRARTSTAALYLMVGAASGLALAAVVIYSHLPAGYLLDVVETGAVLCLVRECNLARPLSPQSSPTPPITPGPPRRRVRR